MDENHIKKHDESIKWKKMLIINNRDLSIYGK